VAGHQASAPEITADGRIKLPYLIVRAGGLPQPAIQAIASATGITETKLVSAPRDFVVATYDRVVLEVAGKEVASEKLGNASLGGQVEGAFYVDKDNLADLRAGNYRFFLDYTHPIANFSSLSLDLSAQQISNTWVDAFREVTRSKSTSGGKVLFMDFSRTVSRTRVKESVRAGGLHEGSTSINVVLRDPTSDQVERVESVLGFAKLTREEMLARHQAGYATAIAAANPELAKAHEKYIEAFAPDAPNTSQQLIDALSKLKDSDALQFMAAGFQMRESSSSSYYRYDYNMIVEQTSSNQTQYREFLIRNASVSSRYFAHSTPNAMARALDAAFNRLHMAVFQASIEVPLSAQQWAQGVRRAINSGDRLGISYALSDDTKERVVAIDPDIAIDPDGNRLLHAAARKQDRSSVDALLAAGASPLRRNQAGDTPADAAQDAGDSSLQALLLGQSARRGSVKLVFTHMPNARLRFTMIAPQDLPGTITRTNPTTVEWNSTDYARLVRLSGHLELEFSLNFNECNMIRFAMQRAPTPSGCLVRAPVALQRLVRYPVNDTNEYRLRIQFVDWETGFQLVVDNGSS
jgi:hypothetical protein